MSTRYDLICLDCNEEAGFRWNHGSEEIARIWAARRELVELFAMIRRVEECSTISEIEVQVRIGYGENQPDHDFFSEHADHNVRIINEYGRLEDDCLEPFRCSGECDHTHQCNLRHDHDGRHQKVKIEDRRPSR